MKILVVLLAVAGIFYFFFWDSFFGAASDADEGGELIVDAASDGGGDGGSGESAAHAGGAVEQDLQGLVQQERWSEVAALLDRTRKARSLGGEELALYQRALLRCDRVGDARSVIEELLAQDPPPAAALGAALELLPKIESPAERRILLGRTLARCRAVARGDVAPLVEAVRGLNRDLPHSLDGVIPCLEYEIKPNDSLWEICRRHNREHKVAVEIGTVKWLNGLHSDTIYPGQVLSLPLERTRIVVWKDSWLLAVFLGDGLLTAYPVGLGKSGGTPEGTFEIATKLEHPDWNSRRLGRVVPYGDPENVLGTRWLGFKSTPRYQGYGIHGTDDPDSIGKNMSEGCIRLRNADVEELFDIIAKGTSVEII